MVERWWSGESSIQLMRGPRWEAESWAWDWPIVMGEPEWEGEMLLKKLRKKEKEKEEKKKKKNKNKKKIKQFTCETWKDGRTVAQRSRIHSVDVSALTHCCCEYDGAVALAWTDFKDMGAGKDIP